MQAAALTDIGLVRRRNEDHYLVDLARGLFVVADGMGGHQAGDVASRLAVETIAAWIPPAGVDNPPLMLAEAVSRANEAVYRQSRCRPDNQGMGTTVTAALVKDGILYVAHVGDSRAYLLRQGAMEAITLDHSFVGELVRRGGITEAEAMDHPQRNMLTRALGIGPLVDADMAEVPLARGDFILLCTDGLSGVVEKEEIGMVVREAGNLQLALENLISLALAHGGSDNITVVLVHYD
ncbi:hypothetical protein SY88_01190 [Clostridiales bacterium PH28_bin88]|nr:hypothetical protein SY88_01190 [Clostridiales bacterium PH28_bin88]